MLYIKHTQDWLWPWEWLDFRGCNPQHCTRISPLYDLFPWEEEAKHVHINDPDIPACNYYTPFLRSAQFHRICFLPNTPWGGLSASPLILVTKQSHFKRENVVNSTLCCVLNLDSCLSFKSLHWTFSWPDVSCHTLHSLCSSSVPVGRMEWVPWQPAVPNGICLSALRITVGKRASFAVHAAAADGRTGATERHNPAGY